MAPEELAAALDDPPTRRVAHLLQMTLEFCRHPQSLADIKKYGLSYSWNIRGKKVSGYCNVNGKGKITEFKQGLN